MICLNRVESREKFVASGAFNCELLVRIIVNMKPIWRGGGVCTEHVLSVYCSVVRFAYTDYNSLLFSLTLPTFSWYRCQACASVPRVPSTGHAAPYGGLYLWVLSTLGAVALRLWKIWCH